LKANFEITSSAAMLVQAKAERLHHLEESGLNYGF